MAVIERSALVLHSARQMFDLVNDVIHYPSFLPWCDGVELHSQTDQEIVASLNINKSGVKQRFTTRNQLIEGHRIEMNLVDGPFTRLTGAWGFKALNETACKVSLDLHFEVSGSLKSMALSKVFQQVANAMVDAFVKRAGDVYGK